MGKGTPKKTGLTGFTGFELPGNPVNPVNPVEKNSWPCVRLGDVCEFRRGLTYSKKDEVALSRKVVLRSNNVDLMTGKIDLSELKYISDSFVVPPEKMVIRGTVLMCMANGSKSHLGKVALVDEDYGYAFGGFMGLIVPSSDIVPSYLYWILSGYGFKRLIESLTDGANINNLKFADIAGFEFPLPPLSVQREIVALLERELGAVDKLTKKFEELEAAAEAEFKAELKETFEEIKHRGTETRRLGDACVIKTGKKDVRQGNPNGQYPFFTCAKIPTHSDTYSFDCPALLVAGNGDVGYTQKYVGKFEAYQRTYVLSCFSQNVDIDYLHHLMVGCFQSYAQQMIMGNTMPYIKMGVLENFEIPLPPHSVQREVVVRLDAAKAKKEKLAAAARRGRETAALLRKAILKEAFE